MFRFAVLLVYCLSSFANSLAGFAFASIAKKAAVFYGVSYNAINQVSVVGLLCPFFGYPVAMWLADKHRFEIPYYLSMIVVVGIRWVRVSHGSDPTVNSFIVVLITQGIGTLVSPLLGCLAPALSTKYFPKEERGIATSLGTIATLLGIGGGMVLSPMFGDDIPALLYLQAMLMTIPFGLSIFVLDCCACFLDDEDHTEESGVLVRTTSFHRLVRSVSQRSTPSEQGFTPILPEEHALWATPNLVDRLTSQVRSHQFDERHRSGNALSRGSTAYLDHAITLPFVYNSGLQSDYVAKRRREEQNLLEELDHDVSRHDLNVPIGIGLGVDICDPTLPDETYCEAMKRVFTNGPFLTLFFSIGLISGVFNAWLALIDETAPPCIDSPQGAQIFCGLFFGFGFIGAVIIGMAMDRTRAYAKIGNVSCILSNFACILTFAGWHYDNAAYIYIGIALVGLLGFGFLPLCIEYGLDIVNESQPRFKRSPDLGGAIGGIIQCGSNIFGIGVIAVSTPGNLSWLSTQDIPALWMSLMLIGTVLFFLVQCNLKRRHILLEPSFDRPSVLPILSEAA